MRAFLCLLGCRTTGGAYPVKYFDKNKIYHWGELAESGYQSKDANSCYIVLGGCHTFFTAASICHYLKGSLATFDDKDSLDNAKFRRVPRPGRYKTAKCDTDEDKYESCQWIGVVRKVWTWSSLGTSL